MTEKEKGQAGMLYDPNHDSELQREMIRSKQLNYEYNLLPPNKVKERDELIKSMLGKCGENILIISPFYCDYGYNIEIGEDFFSNMNLVILDGGKVKIGNNVYIAPNVGIYTAGHPLDRDERRKGLEYAYPVTIGNDVWIGAGVSVLPGVTIGNNCVIGAGSIVTKDIPDNMLAVGNPAKVIKKIHYPKDI